MRTSIRYFLAAVTACLFGAAAPARASGGDGGYAENVYASESHVRSADLERFARGELGVVPGGYWRVYHVLAYRQLRGQQLTAAEFKALNIRDGKVSLPVPMEASEGLFLWLKARESVSQRGAETVNLFALETGRSPLGDASPACTASALAHAASTLQARLAAHGQALAAVWLAQQDAVFANCGPLKGPLVQPDGKPIPLPTTRLAPLPANAPAWLAKDHAYQSAAVQFYAREFGAARAAFLAIGADSSSAWQPWGAYLAARTSIRAARELEAALTRRPPQAGDDPQDAAKRKQAQALWAQAASELRALSAKESAKEPAQAAAAQGLLGWALAQSDPQARRRALGLQLAEGPLGPQAARPLLDYLMLYDRHMRGEDPPLRDKADSLSAWIAAMQSVPEQRTDTLAHIRERAKRESGSLWLVPLTAIAQTDTLRPAERQAADAVGPKDPAHVHLQYHLARLELLRGEAAKADSRIDTLLTQAMNVSTRNRVLGLKMWSAPTENGMLLAAPRQVAVELVRTPIPDEAKRSTDEPAKDHAMGYDTDTAVALHRHLPLKSLLRLKETHPKLPLSLETLWVRAAMLGDHELAQSITAKLRTPLRGPLSGVWDAMQNANTPQARQDAATLMLVEHRHWGPQPTAFSTSEAWTSGYGNWVNLDDLALTDLWRQSPAAVSAEDRSTAQRERLLWNNINRRSDYVGPRLLEYARRNPDDPLVPRALHLFVASTRLEPSRHPDATPATAGKKAKSFSQQAFELLHQRYPKTEWATRTRYHF